MNPNTLKALVRTLTPLLYPLVASAIARFGYHVSNATIIQIVAGGFAGLTVILHSAEAKWPWVGVFMGWLGAPAYAPSTKMTVTQLQAEIDALKAQQAEAAHPSTPTA
jgi:hypothetical protein